MPKRQRHTATDMQMVQELHQLSKADTDALNTCATACASKAETIDLTCAADDDDDKAVLDELEVLAAAVSADAFVSALAGRVPGLNKATLKAANGVQGLLHTAVVVGFDPKQFGTAMNGRFSRDMATHLAAVVCGRGPKGFLKLLKRVKQ